MAVLNVEDTGWIYPMEGGDPRSLPGILPGDVLTGWRSDGHGIFISRENQVPAEIFEVDPATGVRRLWKTLQPEDLTGIIGVDYVCLSPDVQSYACSYRTFLSTLYIASGLR